MRWPQRRPLAAPAIIALVLSSLLLVGSTVGAAAAPRGSGYVYVLNNDLSGENSISTLTRAASGSLALGATTSIGGLGSVTAFADGTQGSLIATPDRSRLFAVDAGSDQISVVDARLGQLSLDGVFSSGGSGPVSLTYGHGWLYVLNAANTSTAAANVTGFRVAANGRLTPIPGATQPLSTSHPDPAQVLLDPSGHNLIVTEKLTNLIDVYAVAADGSLSAPSFDSAVGAFPFGMAFDPVRPPEELLVSDGLGGPSSTGAATAYRLRGGQLHLINGPVDTNQIATCWMVVTQNGTYAYTSNADSGNISGFSVAKDGAISLLTPDGITATAPPNTFPIEEALGGNSRFLYVIDSELLLPTPGPATLSGFQIGTDGSLTSVVDSSQISLPLSAIGLVAD